jgi:D-glutamate N-acetyltransferase
MPMALRPSPAATIGDRLILYTAGLLGDPRAAKTAAGLLRFQPDRVSAVLDPVHAGRRLGDVCPWFSHLDLPVLGSLDDVACLGTELVVGFAPRGGLLAPEQRALLLRAIAAGLRVVNGLHELLPEGPNAVNLRYFDPADRILARGVEPLSTRVLTVGTSANVGKMTAAALLAGELRQRGLRAQWLATGQTGLTIQGFGRVIDAIPLDFVPGVIEALLTEMEATSDAIVVEGQGSLLHPAYAPSTFALVHAVRPRSYVVCHRLGESVHPGFKHAVPSVEQIAESHAKLAETLGIVSRLLGVALDASAAAPGEFQRERAEIERCLQVPCCDPVTESAAPLADALLDELAGDKAS